MRSVHWGGGIIARLEVRLAWLKKGRQPLIIGHFGEGRSERKPSRYRRHHEVSKIRCLCISWIEDLHGAVLANKVMHEASGGSHVLSLFFLAYMIPITERWVVELKEGVYPAIKKFRMTVCFLTAYSVSWLTLINMSWDHIKSVKKCTVPYCRLHVIMRSSTDGDADCGALLQQ